MKTAIIYYSKHHGNTKKLLDAIKSTNEIGGIAKGHPTDQEIQGAVDFYKSLG